MVELLKSQVSTFTWSSKYLTGVESTLITHKLSIDKNVKPIQQKKRRFILERQQLIKEEVNKLLSAGLIKEVQYPIWLNNVVLLKKTNEKWRMCVDFIDLNKTCLKDHYPLPSIDKLVDLTSVHTVVSFLDAISGYHQIMMDTEDAEKTSFITDERVFYYKVMPFKLKNVGVMYQRLVSEIFKDILGSTVEIYVDDMVVKSRSLEEHLEDIRRVFDTLDKAGMKLNPKKCTFRIKA